MWKSHEKGTGKAPKKNSSETDIKMYINPQ